MNTINLGDKIELSGSHLVDGASMIVLKKMIGNHFREMSQIKPVNKLLLNIEKEDQFFITAKMLGESNEFASEISHPNLFMGIDFVLKDIKRQL
ncbi:MAG: hypothetical protein QW331_01615 [Candidatus Woesearchaeota archaeon]